MGKDKAATMEFCQKPSRSDVRLSREEELETEAKTREFFNALTPLRHFKPSRSEYSSLYVNSCKSKDPIPQLAEFQRLEKDSMPKIDYDGCEVPEEFVGTEYYEDLNCIDKQHHTTGSRFIKMENTGGLGFHLAPHSAYAHASCRNNPATNDWVPTPSNDLGSFTFTCGKPKRSDN